MALALSALLDKVFPVELVLKVMTSLMELLVLVLSQEVLQVIAMLVEASDAKVNHPRAGQLLSVVFKAWLNVNFKTLTRQLST